MSSKQDSTKPTIELEDSILDLKSRLLKQAEGFTPKDSKAIWKEYGPPVSPKEFIESEKYFGNSYQKTIYPWVIETIEEICSGDNYCPKYNTAVIMAGKGSGKSYLTGILLAYYWYWYLSFNSFSTWLKERGPDFDDTQTVTFVGMAKTGKQVKEIVFANTGKFINRIQALKDREWLPDSNITSEFQYCEKDKSTGYKNKKLVVIPGNSSSTFGLGYNIFFGALDEVCFFREKLKDPVEDIYDELDTRRRTRFGNNGLNIMISSANVDSDFASGFENKAVNDPLIYFKRISTYKCQPQYFNMPTFEYKCKRERATGEVEDLILNPPLVLQPLYEADPIKTLKDYDAIPSVVGKAFYSDYMMLITKINRERPDPCPDLGQDKPESPNEVAKRLDELENFKGIPGVSYTVHCDLSKGNISRGNCGCGFAMVHKVAHPQLIFKVSLDLAVRFKAPENKDIQLNEVLELIKFLKDQKGFNIDLVTFDEYQSQALIQNISTWPGTKSRKQSVGYKEHGFMKGIINSGQFDFYNDINLIYELKRLEDYETAIDTSAYKDEADATAGACFSCAGVPADEDSAEGPPKPRAHGMMVGRGSQGGRVIQVDQTYINLTPRTNYGRTFIPKFRRDG